MPKFRAASLPSLVLALFSQVLALPFGTSRLAAQTIRKGVEFQVNSYTGNLQHFSSVSLDADGDFVVAWQSSDQDGSSYGVFARRFSSAGTALATEFQVSSYTGSSQLYPSVSLDAGGDFVVAWTGNGQDGSSYGVFARRFSSAGTALATEFQVNSFTNSNQRFPAVSLDADGDFVVAWQSFGQDSNSEGIFARRFSSAGTALAAEFQVSSYTSSSQAFPSVSLDDDGDFVVAWQSDTQDGSSNGVFARRFSSAGTAQAGEFQVSSYTTSYQLQPSVSLDADGDFVVAWSSAGQDGSIRGVFARRFSFTGSAQAGEFQVSSYTTNSQSFPSVSFEADGDFVVAWESNGQDGSSYGVFARRFSSAGVPQSVEFQVSSYTASAQRFPSLSFDDDGDFVVAWESDTQDGSSNGVFAQRFGTPAALDIDGNGATSALTDGLLVLRYLFGFTGPTLVGGAVDAGSCTRCDAAAIEGYVASKVAGQTVALGVEFQVSSYTTRVENRPALSLDSDGDFVVAWSSSDDVGSASVVFARRFSSQGTAQASEFQVSSYTAGSERIPSVSLDADGDSVVAWISGGQDGSDDGIFARRFSSQGVAQAVELQVSSYTAGTQRIPSVSLDADGDSVVAWTSDGQDGSGDGVFARRFSSAGTAQAGEFQVTSYTVSAQRLPSVSLEGNGDFVVAWVSLGQDGDGPYGPGVFARRFSSAGVGQAGEFQVSSFTTNDELGPSVSVDADGDFVVAWQSFGDGDYEGIFARRFSSTGVALAGDFQVSSFTVQQQSRPSVSVAAGGAFVVAWQSDQQDGSGDGVFARRFSSAGVPQAAELQVSSYITGDQYFPAVSIDDGGDFVVAWTSSGQDGWYGGVFAQRFGAVSAFDIDGNGATGALTDGLLVLRYLFGFTGATLVTGAVDLVGCTRCQAGPIEAYLATLL